MNNPIQITILSPKHTNGCEPSSAQLLICRQLVRDYGHISKTILGNLLKLMDVDPTLKCKTIREMLTKVYPKMKYANSTDIHNMRIRAKVY